MHPNLKAVVSMAACFWLALMPDLAKAARPVDALILNKIVLMRQNGVVKSVEVSLFQRTLEGANRRLYYLRNGSNIISGTNDIGAFFRIDADHALNNFALIKLKDKNDCYLTWTDDSFICLTRIPESDSELHFDTDLADYFPSYWIADYYIDLRCYDGFEKHFKNDGNEWSLTATSAALEQDGLTFTATNGYGTSFKFSLSDQRWHIFNDGGEMQQEKSNSNNLTNLLEEQSIAWPELFKSKLTLKGKNGEFQDIDVSFVQKYYKSRKIPMVAFQLVESTNNEIAFSRPVYETFHGESHLGNYSLVKNSTGDGYYFSWTDYFSRLCLITIPDIIPNGKYTDDPNVGFFANSPNDPLMRGGVDHIIGMQGYFEGWERFFKGGGGVASAREANNVLTLTVTNAAGSKFTFSNQDGQWHAYSFWGEISRVKPTP